MIFGPIIKTIRRLLLRFNLLVIKIPNKISVNTIKERAIEKESDSFYLKMLTSFYLSQNKLSKIEEIITALGTINSVDEHQCWIYNGSEGRGSLNVYRIVKFDNKKLLHKYYFTNSIEKKKATYFHQNIQHLISSEVMTSKLHEIRNAELITTLIYSFIEDNSTEKTSNSIISLLNLLSNSYKLEYFNNILTCVPEYLMDYRGHFEYERAVRQIKEHIELSKFEKVIFKYEDRIKQENSVLSHGDLHAGNFIGSYIIDWDNFGFLPLGFDAAFWAWKLNVQLDSEIKVLHFLETNFLNHILAVDKEEFKNNFIYFLIIFSRVKDHWMLNHLNNL